jgi:hypothetical protein
MLRDLFFYFVFAVTYFGAAILFCRSLNLTAQHVEYVILAPVYYAILGGYVVFSHLGTPSNHAPGHADFKTAGRNIWWAMWWPWYVFNRQ